MAKTPASNSDPMLENSNDSPAGDLFASHWTELTDMGDHMMRVGSRMSKLGKERAKPRRRDLAEFMRLGAQMMRVGSQFLQEAAPTAAGAGNRPSKRKSWPATANELGPNGSGNDKITRLSKDSWKGPDDAISLALGDSVIDEKKLLNEPLYHLDFSNSDVDLNFWNESSVSDLWNATKLNIASTASATTLCSGAARDQDGRTSPVKSNPSSDENRSRDRKQGRFKKATYLNRLVASTGPKMPLAEYLQGIDGRLVCLCGRGGHWQHHAGNKDYLDLIQSKLQDYKSLSRKGKEEFTNSLVQELEDQGRRFLRVYDGEWEEMDRLSIRRKVSQNFRDACDTGTAQSNSDGSASPPAA